MGKTRDLFKKKRYQRNISCKDGHKKDRNGMDLTEADIVARIHRTIQKREGNGNPLQYSCLDNLMDGGAW